MTTPAPKIQKNERFIDEDGTLGIRSKRFLDELAQPIFISTGSPEGVIVAPVTSLCMDDSGTAGNILYIKRDADIGGDRSRGWILI